MATDWYYTKGDEQIGPVSAKELKRLAGIGGLQPSDQIWKEGMKEWEPAGTVEGLFPSPPKPPQQAKPPKPTPPPLHKHQGSQSPAPPPPPKRNPSSESSQHGGTAKSGSSKPAVLTKAAAVVQQAKDYAQSEAVQSRLAALRRMWESWSKNQRLGVFGGSAVVGLFLVVWVFSSGSNDGSTGNGGSSGGGTSVSGGGPAGDGGTESEGRAGSDSDSSSGVTKRGKYYDEGFLEGVRMANGHFAGTEGKLQIEAAEKYVNALYGNYKSNRDFLQERFSASGDGSIKESLDSHSGICDGMRSVMVKHGL